MPNFLAKIRGRMGGKFNGSRGANSTAVVDQEEMELTSGNDLSQQTQSHIIHFTGDTQKPSSGTGDGESFRTVSYHPVSEDIHSHPGQAFVSRRLFCTALSILILSLVAAVGFGFLWIKQLADDRYFTTEVLGFNRAYDRQDVAQSLALTVLGWIVPYGCWLQSGLLRGIWKEFV
jgi:hypothetical protein